jgi:hypothetical protein
MVDHDPSTKETPAPAPGDAVGAIASAMTDLPDPHGNDPTDSSHSSSVHDDDFVPAGDDDDKMAPVPLEDEQHALAAEGQCLHEINLIRIDSGMTPLVMQNIIAEAQVIVSHGILYDFQINVTDGTDFISVHLECDAVHDPTNTGTISDYVVEGIPEPNSIFPDAWLQQAHETQLAAGMCV